MASKALPSPIRDSLSLNGWIPFESGYAKDGFILTIQTLRNGNFAIEIRKMSVARTITVSMTELEQFIAKPGLPK